MSSATASVVAGLASGIVLIGIFSSWDASLIDNKPPEVSTIVIPEGASLASSGKNFEPNTIKVMIGVNNTVRWTNNDSVLSSVVADNVDVDPDFAAATIYLSSFIPENATNFLSPGESFEFTFNHPGEIGYHSEPHPWMRGTVMVLPPESKS